ncbi:condensation domain-containing protein, partial [Brevibacterium aurantiacum]|uniref:condensation domain-containing protein n=1 Tax=Brevibacterium aurantiacum TaxID=273384 RepID=UPI001F0EB9E1
MAWEEQYGPINDVQPLTPLQQGLVFHTELDAEHGVDAYLTQTVLRFTGAIDPERMRHAVQTTLEHYPNLKASIVTNTSGEYVSVIPATVEVPFTVVDVAGSDDFETTVTDHADSQRAMPFILTQPPLLRGVLIQNHDRDRNALILTAHHSLLDGWSATPLITYLLQSYRRPSQAPQANKAYTQFLEWHENRDRSESESAWSAVLSTLESPSIVAPGVRNIGTHPESFKFSIKKEVNEALTALAQTAGATLSTLVQAAWGVFLNTITGQETVVFGTTVSGRPAEIDG